VDRELLLRVTVGVTSPMLAVVEKVPDNPSVLVAVTVTANDPAVGKV